MGRTAYRTKAELAYQAIRNAIKAQQFAPGERLAIGSLSEQLGMSAVPLREAMSRLGAEGLVQTDTHRGFFIPHLSADDLVDIYETLALLEPRAARLALPNMHAEDIDAAERILAELTALESSPGEWVERNYAFHMTLYRPSARPRLLAAISRLAMEAMGELQRHQSYLDFLVRSDAEHREILALVRADEPDELARALTSHIGRTCELVVRQKGEQERSKGTGATAT